MRHFVSIPILFLVLFFLPQTVFSDVDIVASPSAPSGSIPNSINNFYNMALVLGGIAAVGVIVAGGIMYAASGAIDKKNAGKELITSSIWGLILLLGAFIILNTINPRITRLSENMPDINGGVGGFKAQDYKIGTPEDPFSCENFRNVRPCEDGKTATDDDDACCNPPAPAKEACTEERINACPAIVEGEYKEAPYSLWSGCGEIETSKGTFWQHLYYEVDKEGNVVDTQCVAYYKKHNGKLKKINCVVWGNRAIRYGLLGKKEYKPCNYQ